MVSYGEGQDDASLFMTYMFEVVHPGIEQGSEEAAELYENTKNVSAAVLIGEGGWVR